MAIAASTDTPVSDFERVPPHSSEAERSVLGAMMLDEHALALAIDIVKQDSFYFPAHRIIFSAISKLFEQKAPVDSVSITAELQSQAQLEKAGGPAYISELIDAVPTTANIEHYAKIVLDKYLVRELIRSTYKIAADCYRGDMETEQLIETAEQDVFKIAQYRSRSDFVKLSDLMMPAIEDLEQNQSKKGSVSGVDTGFEKLNEMTTGFHGGELIIIAARPAMGKTAFALNIAEHVAVAENRAVAIFSLEMTAKQLVMRLLASHARVEGQRLRRGTMSQRDWTALIQAGTALKKANIFIDSSSQLTPLEVRARCRRLKSEQPSLSLVMIDYIQLMDAMGRGIDSRQQEIAYISRSLKAMASELNLPVVALSQLNRESERGREKGSRPQLSQLRESGAIEQDADVVMLLYRPAYYSDEDKYKNRSEIILAKQRNGPTGTIHLVFHDSFARFEDPPPGFIEAIAAEEEY